MDKIHFKFIKQMLSDCDVVKALALSIFVKMNTVSSTVNRCTVNKLHELTGLHSNTIKKRMKTLQEMGLLICGQNNNVTFITLQSSCKKKNVLFDFTKYKSVSELEYALYSLLLKDVLSKKEYMKKEIDEIKNLETPADANESRSIKRRIKKLRKYIYAHRNTTGLSITEEEYKEYGISYDTIARKLGVCRQKAVEIVKFALKYRLITKDKRVVQMHMKDVGICSKFVFPDGLPKGFFCTKDNIYKVFANIYHNVEAS